MSILRKTASLLLVVIFAAVSFAGCSGNSYNDGTYTSQLAEFESSGWKDTMEVTIQGGKIVKINWDAIYKDDTIPIRKKQYSKSGLYGMLAVGAVGEWYDQAVAAEQYVLENGIDSLNVKDDGYSDAVSGCTVHVSSFDKLVRECLAKAKK